MTDNQADIWIQIQVEKKTKILIGMLYREWTSIDGKGSATDQKERFLELISNAEKAIQEKTEVIIMGDINVNIGTTTGQTGQRNLKEIIKEFENNNNMTQLIREHTRCRIVSGELQSSTIDHIYTNMPDNITDLSQTKPASSDHSMIYFTRKISNTGKTNNSQEKRCYKLYTPEIFNEDLANRNWETVLNENDVDKAVEKLSKNISNVLDRHAPYKMYSIRTKPKRVITQETINEMKKRDKLMEEYKKHKTEEKLQAWKASKKKVTGYLKRDKRNTEQENFSSPTKAWQYINNNRGARAIRGGPPTKLIIDGKETSNDNKIAEHMNKYFINKI